MYAVYTVIILFIGINLVKNFTIQIILDTIIRRNGYCFIMLNIFIFSYYNEQILLAVMEM